MKRIRLTLKTFTLCCAASNLRLSRTSTLANFTEVEILTASWRPPAYATRHPFWALLARAEAIKQQENADRAQTRAALRAA